MTASNGSTCGGGSGSQGAGQEWGRVLIAGGTDWPNLGRKKAAGAAAKPSPDATPTDLVTPHILRQVSNYKISKIFAGHSACHSVFVTLQGDVFVYGRNEKGQCGLPTTPTSGQEGGVAIEEPFRLDRSAHFQPPLDKTSRGDIVHAACGRSHTLLVTRGGSVYAAGSNATSQLALSRVSEAAKFSRIEGAPWTKAGDPVVEVSAGLTFSLFLTREGRVYACGSMEKGQLGNGRTGEHFVSGNRMAFAEESTPILIKGLADKKIVSISSGQQHSIAMDDQGFCYAWGFGGYGRLGLGDANDRYVPELVPQFARANEHGRAASVYAGPSNSAVIDRSATYYLAGKWKTSGDGGAGQGWTSFRYMQALMGCKVRKAALGGVTLFCIADEIEAPKEANPGATMNVAWGQNAANGELGLGEGKPKSATQPQRCEPLDGIALMDVAAGQNTTFFLARNCGEVYSELPRFPDRVDFAATCLACNTTKPESEVQLECEKCEEPYHLSCLDPPLTEAPDGEWFCEVCDQEGGYEGGAGGSSGHNGRTFASAAKKGGKAGAAKQAESEEKEAGDAAEDEDDDDAASASPAEDEKTPARRGRGRPRGGKAAAAATPRKSAGTKRKADDDAPAPKRGRGRPRN